MGGYRAEVGAAGCTPRLLLIPLVTPEQYRRLTCNRCGGCCDDLRWDAVDPDQLAARIAAPDTPADQRRFLSGLALVGRVGGAWRYRCRHFARDEAGLGVCTSYATRPEVCRSFPNGQVVRLWPQCAWFVDVRDARGAVVPVVSPLAPDALPVAEEGAC